MINYISSWAEQIIIAVIVVTILEMILPNGNSKKYIKTIIGIYVLYVILSPAIKLITGGELKIDYGAYEKYFKSEEISGNLENVTIQDTYKVELEKQIKIDIEKLGFNVKKVNADFNLEEGKITKIVLSVDKNKEKTGNIVVSINRVEVGNIKEENTLTQEEIQKIIKKLTEDYGVDSKNITINSL